MFIIKQMSEKLENKNKCFYVAYMYLEKAYDRIDRDAMWRFLDMYGINGKFLKALQNLYTGSEGCVSVCREEGEWFEVGVGLRQGCVMSPWLFNSFKGVVMREVRQKVNDVDAIIWDARIHCKWKMEWLMFAKDKVLKDWCMNSKEYVRGKIGKRR